MPAFALSICRRIALASPIEREIARLAHDGNDEAVVIEVDGDAEIDVARQPQRLALEARVDPRKGGDGETGGARDERQIGEREAVRLLERLLALRCARDRPP